MAGKDKLTSPPSSDYGIASLLAHWKQQARQTVVKVADTVDLRDQVIRPESGQLSLTGVPPEILISPDILLEAAIVNFGDKTTEGQLIKEVAIPWFQIIKELERDPEFLSKLSPRKFEELIAGAYEQEGWDEVILTPRSRDGGRDVIATRRDFGSIRFIDEVKKYKPGSLVPPSVARSIIGVLERDKNVSKAVITTTARISPRIEKEFGALIPNRLVLKDGKELKAWLLTLLPH